LDDDVAIEQTSLLPLALFCAVSSFLVCGSFCVLSVYPRALVTGSCGYETAVREVANIAATTCELIDSARLDQSVKLWRLV
jgi:hypothetical protein